ncbi:MAG: MarR family transcriptional regulator [Spirochaetales bacterium]|nr:MarR family transcriptional regulator [Spirochaetales bacterium]
MQGSDVATEELKLRNQICFPLYAASRLVIREYKPYLDKLGITYPQYLALMVLWETDGVTVSFITDKLILNTNTVTPVLKRLEQMGLVERTPSPDDERSVIVMLTRKGRELERKAAEIPLALAGRLTEGPFSHEELSALKSSLDRFVAYLKCRGSGG